MEETFVKCLFSDSHLIGNAGTVKSTHGPRVKRYGTDVLTGMIKPDGYKLYYICGKWHYAHRLVALHFIGDSNGLTDVNHIDGNKLNNHVSNLEWCTHAANMLHSFKQLGRTVPRGKDHYGYGKKMSVESRAKMSAAKQGRKRKDGKWL